eukprot:1093253_1
MSRTNSEYFHCATAILSRIWRRIDLPLPRQAEHYPESLRLLPSFCLGLLKCTAFRDGTDVPPDVRSSAFNVFSGASSRYVDLMLRPRLFNLGTVLSGKVGCVDASGICTLPEEMPP